MRFAGQGVLTQRISMTRCISWVVLYLILVTGAGAIGNMCSPGLPTDLGGGCSVDGTGCDGEAVELLPYQMNVSKWDPTSKTSLRSGHITSYAIKGEKNTWQMYLHGPHFHERERTDPEAIPPVYVFATFTNQVYRFEQISKPVAGQPQPLKATQKIVGHALAPSTGFVIEGPEDKHVKGLLIAEGQPFYFDDDDVPPKEIYKGGVQYLPSGHTKNCTSIFPLDLAHRPLGQVVNTVDCHKGTGVCFFTVWKFYDDQSPLWNNFTANDCLYYCIMEKDSLLDQPSCRKTAIVVDDNGEKICHKHGVGAVHGMTVGNTDPSDETKFDILLVFTGKAAMDNGESSMKKVTVQVVPTTDSKGATYDMKVVHSAPFAEDLFTKYAPKGFDVGGDHAWVDATGKYVWVSCFRSAGVGAHMLDYETGELLYSVTGLDKYLPTQYTYTAGIHGVGTLGQKGSYLAIATSSCHELHTCIPTVPWHWPVPKSWWSTAPLFIIDLASMTEDGFGHDAVPQLVLV